MPSRKPDPWPLDKVQRMLRSDHEQGRAQKQASDTALARWVGDDPTPPPCFASELKALSSGSKTYPGPRIHRRRHRSGNRLSRAEAAVVVRAVEHYTSGNQHCHDYLDETAQTRRDLVTALAKLRRRAGSEE